MTQTESDSVSPEQTKQTEQYDVIIIGAGISGIGAAVRLRQEHPDLTFTILERRERVGGTWDLFRYPGIRSDSDMYTLSYPFHPWRERESIASGPAIRSYVEQTAATYELTDKIETGVRVTDARWSSDDQQWTLQTITGDGADTEHRQLSCRFVYLATGYYSHDNPYRPQFEGADSFEGVIADPQFWPEELDYAGKKVVVIGSGATAVTIVPAMAKTAEHVTMLQRTPTYMAVLPEVDESAIKIRERLPKPIADRYLRTRGIVRNAIFYQLCRRKPELAKARFREVQLKMIGDEKLIDDHLTPPYEPWDQRLCAVPDGDFFTSLRAGTSSIVTDHIDRFVPEGIKLKSGEVLEADIIVPATGITMLAGGGINMQVDGEPIDLADSWLYKGFLLSGVPNLAWCIGYATSSWTLRADLTARWWCKLISHMRRHSLGVVTVQAEPGLDAKPLLALTSGYVQRTADTMPKQAGSAPWLLRQNYLRDSFDTFKPAAPHLRYARKTTVRAITPGADTAASPA